ncbi:MAG: Ldh family oxidoreductase [Clostridia bacterium]|jgi:LDH2 family malate/lactate/ureidoglycolate dehydrogenase|nr:Ldh family oxidoreductase [Clostridia bacterium]MCI2013927.1 Ldh family oxidoreductase [Clostridia bacterium]
MGYVKIQYETLKTFSNVVFEKMGFNKNDAGIITDVLLTSDMYGIESHGVQRMVLYYKTIKNGRIHMDAKWEIVHETPLSAVIDNHFGVGQLVGNFAMNMAIDKAKKSGIGIVSVRNSNHYGIAGYYAKMACKEGLIGFSTTNSEAIMVPTYGRMAMLGSNPIAVAVPAEPYDFLFDAATTVVTRGKVEVYNKKGEPLPDGWTLGADGLPATNAPDILKNINEKRGGGILPLGGATEQFGGHKGYGWGMVAEIFSSILSMGLTSNHTHIGSTSGTCHCFAAIDPSLFGNPEEIKEHFSNFLKELRESPKAQGQTRIYTHGEKEVEAYNRILKEGIPVNQNTLKEMKLICDEYGIDMEKYLGKLEF